MTLNKLLEIGFICYINAHGPIVSTHITRGISITPSILKRCRADNYSLQNSGRMSKFLRNAIWHWLNVGNHEKIDKDNLIDFLNEISTLESYSDMDHDFVKEGGVCKSVRYGFVTRESMRQGVMNSQIDISVFKNPPTDDCLYVEIRVIGHHKPKKLTCEN